MSGKKENQFTISDSLRLPSTKSFYDLARNKPVSGKERSFFFQHGLADSSGRSKIFCYYENGSLDRLCSRLKKQYIKMIRGIFDYNKLSHEFNVPPEEMFLIVSHEIAYEIFSILKNDNSIYIPILKENNPKLDFYTLVSWKFTNSDH